MVQTGRSGSADVHGTRLAKRQGQILAPVAQQDRVSDFESEGCWFESSQAHQKRARVPFGESAFFAVSEREPFSLCLTAVFLRRGCAAARRLLFFATAAQRQKGRRRIGAYQSAALSKTRCFLLLPLVISIRFLFLFAPDDQHDQTASEARRRDGRHRDQKTYRRLVTGLGIVGRF